MRREAVVTCCACLAAMCAMPAHAGEWQQEVAPYVWAAGMSGKSGVGNVVADVDMSFGDIVDDLQIGFMGAYRASKDRWSFTVDGIYMALGVTEHGPGGALKADIDLDQTALEVDTGYAVLDQLTLIAGLRYIDLSVKVKAEGPLGNVERAHNSKSWMDPVLGASYRVPFNDAWSLMLRGDIGGFGVGSDFAWQGAATLRWQAKPTFGVLAAYRYIDMDYDSGSGAKTFKYDMTMSGPALGVVFSF